MPDANPTDVPRYSPADASLAPRYTGIRTFARCPHVIDLEGVDIAVVGVPFDTATRTRVGVASSTGAGTEAISVGDAAARCDATTIARHATQPAMRERLIRLGQEHSSLRTAVPPAGAEKAETALVT